MKLGQNMASLNVYMNYSKVLKNQSEALQRITSGIKLNSSKDNPNAIASSEKLNMQIRGLQMAGRNLQDGVSMLQTAEGGMNEITSILQRVRELSVQASSDTYNLEDKQVIQKEIDQMLTGIDSLSDITTFNDIKILNNTFQTPITMAIGANSGETVDIPTYNLSKDNLGTSTLKLSDIDVTADNGGNTAVGIVDSALQTVIRARSKYGALENRFESSMDHVNVISDKLEISNSNIKDADIAAEIIEYSKGTILSEAGNAMMAQTNKMPQEVLRILENMK